MNVPVVTLRSMDGIQFPRAWPKLFQFEELKSQMGSSMFTITESHPRLGSAWNRHLFPLPYLNEAMISSSQIWNGLFVTSVPLALIRW